MSSPIWKAATVAPLLAALGCAPQRLAPSDAAPPYTPHSAPWVDRTLAHMTLRQKAAQMVWPRTFGDYAAADAAAWRQLEREAREDSVGGFIISVGSPIEIAAKLDALQRVSAVPLIVGADL